MENTIDFTRINNDTNGNPRYVCHFLNLLTDEEKGYYKEGEGYIVATLPLSARYGVAVKRANKIGGRRYHTKSYGGGIVFQSYDIAKTEKDILNLI